MDVSWLAQNHNFKSPPPISSTAPPTTPSTTSSDYACYTNDTNSIETIYEWPLEEAIIMYMRSFTHGRLMISW